MQKIIEALKGKDLGFWAFLFLVTFALIGFGVACLMMGKTLDGISIIVGCLITQMGTLINYRYGSSKGSKDKTELLSKVPPVTDWDSLTPEKRQEIKATNYKYYVELYKAKFGTDPIFESPEALTT